MASFDRTDIVRLLSPIWPELQTMLSSEVQSFLNQATNSTVTSDLPNSTAFDIWRQAIAKQTEHKHVWPYSQDQVDQIQIKAREMKAAEIERQKKLDGQGIQTAAVSDSQ